MITQRAILVSFVGFCFYLIALVNNLPSAYYALTWLSVGILVSSLGVALLSLVGVECQWHVSSARVCEAVEMAEADADTQRTMSGTAALDMATNGPAMDVQLSNGGTLNKTGVLLEVRLQPARREGQTPPAPVARRFLIEALPSGASIATTLALRDLPRGRYTIAELRLTGADVLGLFRVSRRLALASGGKDTAGQSAQDAPELIVGPAMIALPEGSTSPRLGAAGGSLNTAQLLGQGDEMRGTRQYVPGDDLRHVHWKSTARQGQLVVKEFHRTAQAQSVVIWDGATGTVWGRDDVTTLEYGLRLTASLCRALLEQSRPCGLLRLDSRPLWLPPGGRNGRTALKLAQIVDVLADADAARATALAPALAAYLGGLPAGGDVFLVTASLAPDVRQAVLALRARGVRVAVGLLDGAAFYEAAAEDYGMHLWTEEFQLRLKRQGARQPVQRWTVRDAQGQPSHGEAPVDATSYQAQAEALRAYGVPVVMLAPPHEETTALSHFAAPVRAALRELLDMRLPEEREAAPGL